MLMMPGWMRLERDILSRYFDFSCFAFAAAVEILALDEVE